MIANGGENAFSWSYFSLVRGQQEIFSNLRCRCYSMQWRESEMRWTRGGEGAHGERRQHEIGMLIMMIGYVFALWSLGVGFDYVAGEQPVDLCSGNGK